MNRMGNEGRDCSHQDVILKLKPLNATRVATERTRVAIKSTRAAIEVIRVAIESTRVAIQTNPCGYRVQPV